MKQLFATTARGFEELLKVELTELGATECKIAQGGVHFQADDETLYRSLLWSRLASRILLPIVIGKVYSDLDLYSIVTGQDWLSYFDEKATFFVDFNGTNQEIRHTQFGAMRVKDAIVDYFERQGKARPNVDKDYPDVRIHVYLNKEELVVSLDLSGEALHLRGYREDTGQAPLRETLAAAIVLRSGWTKGTPLVDPMCGSGTLLIEAAQMEAQIAPQLHRLHWGFDCWKGHNQDAWDKVKAEAAQQAETYFNQNPKPHFYGFDLDHRVLKKAQKNAQNAGVAHLIQWKQGDVAALKNPSPDEVGTVICNPPYGERISTPNLLGTYKMIGERLKHQFVGNDAWILSYREECFEQIGLKPSIKIPVFNGSLECEFRKYALFGGRMKEFREEGGIVKTEIEKKQMAEKHRFKKNREFKKKIEEEEENEVSDIRSFKFHSLERKKPSSFRDKNDDERRERRGQRFSNTDKFGNRKDRQEQRRKMFGSSKRGNKPSTK